MKLSVYANPKKLFGLVVTFFSRFWHFVLLHVHTQFIVLLWQKLTLIFFEKMTNLKKRCQNLIYFLQAQWQTWKPELDRLIRAVIALSAIASTFKIALQTIPIIVSIVTILATLPLVSYLFPSFFFTTSLNSTLIFSVIGVISTFAGYSKYKELILRNQLDTMTKTNEMKIEALEKQLQVLKDRLDQMESCLLPTSFLPLRDAYRGQESLPSTPESLMTLEASNHEPHEHLGVIQALQVQNIVLK